MSDSKERVALELFKDVTNSVLNLGEKQRPVFVDDFIDLYLKCRVAVECEDPASKVRSEQPD